MPSLVQKGNKELDLTHREFELLYHLATHVGQVMTREHLLETVWGYDYFGDVRTVDVTVRRLREKSRTHRDVQNISWPAVVLDIIWETMIDQLKQFVMSSNFVFVLITVGFIIVVALLLLENRRDNIKLRQLNAKIKDLIAGDYSEVVDMQGSPELTDMTNSINDLSEVIRLTHENLEQETKRLTSILSYMTDGVLATNRRGQIIMVNEMAAKQLNVNPDEVLNTSILDLLSLGDDYDLRSLITEVPELTIDSQDEKWGNT